MKLLPDICIRAGIPPRAAHAMRRTAICDMFAADIHVSSYIYCVLHITFFSFILKCTLLFFFDEFPLLSLSMEAKS
jgi:hypothetical protein